MAELSPERRAQLAQLLYVNQAAQGEHFGTEGPWWDDADILAPLIAGWLADAREAGAAEVRARVEAVLTEREAELERTRIVTIPEWRKTVGIDQLRAALDGGE